MKKNTKYPMPPYIDYDADWEFSFTMNSDDFDLEEWMSDIDWLKPNTNYNISCKIDDNNVVCTIGYKKPTLVDNLKKWFWRKIK